MIKYVGITTDYKSRFNRTNHKKAIGLVNKKGETYFTYAEVKTSGKNSIKRNRAKLEEVEHILIWTLWHRGMINDKKNNTLPGMGKNRTRPWYIKNAGYEFLGQMPEQIIFPWQLIIPIRL